MPQFTELPYYERSDLSPYLIHLTKRDQDEGGNTALENLMSILREGKVRASDPETGFIKGQHSATCLMDVPIPALKDVLTPSNSSGPSVRYEPYGIVISKPYAYREGARPVLYMSREEIEDIEVPADELWRVVHFDASNSDWSGWLHEREWRIRGDLELPHPHGFTGVLVKSASEAQRVRKMLAKVGDRYRATPRSVIPLQVVCGGLKVDRR